VLAEVKAALEAWLLGTEAWGYSLADAEEKPIALADW
jgi:hypothetical protein